MAPNLDNNTISPSKSIIFDLDGTLIDSEESIIRALQETLLLFGIAPLRPLSREIVGPPLIELLKSVSGISERERLNKLVQAFIQYYDSDGYRHCHPYLGIDNLLVRLKKCGVALYIVTNKRLAPTLKILELFQWIDLFKAVYAIDSIPNAPFVNKADALAHLLNNYDLEKNGSLYIGDRVEDFDAASLNGVDVILVKWGYGDLPIDDGGSYGVAQTVQELENKLMDFLQ